MTHPVTPKNTTRPTPANKPAASTLHPRNPHQGRYDFDKLIKALPELEKHAITNPSGEATINFSDADAVLTLNKALLAHHYNIKYWDLPKGYLCPPIPGRADYIHQVANLLAWPLGLRRARFFCSLLCLRLLASSTSCIDP